MQNPGTFDPQRLERLLGGAELEWLVAALRRRLELGGGERLSIGRVSPAERAAAEALLGRRLGRARSFSVSLSELEAVLQRSGAAPDLISAIAHLSGPLVDRRAERAAAQTRWEAVFAAAADWAAQRGLTDWLEELARDGALKRAAGGDPGTASALLADARKVIDHLPGRGQSLSTLAAASVGDAHALDTGRPLGALVRRAARHLGDGPDEAGDEGLRALWAGVAILVGGAVTATALALRLPAAGPGATARSLAALGEAGEPAWLTLRQLLRDPPRWRVAGRPVHVCENPAVVAEAADALGSTCAPLVCTHGRPGAAVTTLLRQLRAAGAALRYHGDFDWPGLAIGNQIIGQHGVSPWRFSAPDYAAAQAGNPLGGPPVEASWDPTLAAAMAARGLAVHEESVLPALLESLACRAP